MRNAGTGAGRMWHSDDRQRSRCGAKKQILERGSDVRKYRHELKYIISYREKDLIAGRLGEFAGIDEHAGNGMYSIRSLYFDDIRHSAYEEKMAGVVERKKYRIRIYDLGDSYIRLECKRKRGNYIYKDSAGLTREEFCCILAGDHGFLLERPEELLHEFYFECMTNVLRPEVIVDYDRIPYVYDGGTVRITFDMHVRSAFDSFDIFDGSIPSYEVMGGDELIMEVKYTEYLPDIFRSVIEPGNMIRMAASKYTMCDDVKRERYTMM